MLQIGKQGLAHRLAIDAFRPIIYFAKGAADIAVAQIRFSDWKSHAEGMRRAHAMLLSAPHQTPDLDFCVDRCRGEIRACQTTTGIGPAAFLSSRLRA